MAIGRLTKLNDVIKFRLKSQKIFEGVAYQSCSNGKTVKIIPVGFTNRSRVRNNLKVIFKHHLVWNYKVHSLIIAI